MAAGAARVIDRPSGADQQLRERGESPLSGVSRSLILAGAWWRLHGDVDILAVLITTAKIINLAKVCNGRPAVGRQTRAMSVYLREILAEREVRRKEISM
ncbi:MAG: hypothetical protein ACJ79S_06295 [Gemmatimonadaceae bacterium]